MEQKFKNIIYLGPEEMYPLVKDLLQKFNIIFVESLDDLNKFIFDCYAILDASMKIKFDKSLLIKAKKLELFVAATTGSSHIDVGYLNSKDIPLLTLQGQRKLLNNITPAAELSWLLLLMCARNAYEAVSDVKNGNWDRNKFPGIMLNGKTIGIIGLGRLGSWMVRYANAFGMKCLGYDPFLIDKPSNVQICGLEELLEQSDFVSLHVNYDPNKPLLLEKKHFALIKKGAIIINTSRGELVDEESLLNGLLSGDIGGAGLDVLTGEPEVEKNKLFKYRNSDLNLIISPHIGGFSYDALQNVLKFCCDRIKIFESGE